MRREFVQELEETHCSYRRILIDCRVSVSPDDAFVPGRTGVVSCRRFVEESRPICEQSGGAVGAYVTLRMHVSLDVEMVEERRAKQMSACGVGGRRRMNRTSGRSSRNGREPTTLHNRRRLVSCRLQLPMLPATATPYIRDLN